MRGPMERLLSLNRSMGRVREDDVLDMHISLSSLVLFNSTYNFDRTLA